MHKFGLVLIVLCAVFAATTEASKKKNEQLKLQKNAALTRLMPARHAMFMRLQSALLQRRPVKAAKLQDPPNSAQSVAEAYPSDVVPDSYEPEADADDRSFDLENPDEQPKELPRPAAGVPAAYFPVYFDNVLGSAIAIANSFSTGKGGSATSHAIAYGAPAPAAKV